MLDEIFLRYKKQWIGGLLIVSLFWLFLRMRNAGLIQNFNFFEKTAVTITATFQGWTRDMTRGAGSIWGNYIGLVNTSKQNEMLKTRVSELELKIHTLQEIENENDRLRKLLNFSQRLQHTKLPAQVVAENIQGELRTIRLNKGTRDGIAKGAAVVTNAGVVGRVIRVDAGHSDVLTIIDANSAVDAIAQRTRARGVVEGRNITQLNMKYLQRDDDVVTGDVIVTSGLDNEYPKGIIVGYVSEVSRKSFGISQKVVLQPSVDFTRLEEVFVITGAGP